MQKERLTYLLDKYFKQRLSDEERDELNDWYHALNYSQQDFDTWVSEAGGKEHFAVHLYQNFKHIISVNHKIKRIYYFQRISAAAAVLIFLSVGLYFYSIRKINNRSESGIQKMTFVKSRSNKAILTLSNGKKIDLNDADKGTVIQNAGLKVTKTADGQLVYQSTGDPGASNSINSISTPNGGQYSVILSDGTRVWLNAASSLKFPDAFSGAERRVVLTGEAYFEVAHNKKNPFVVESDGQTVEVLGTHFDIEDYKEGGLITTTLLEGSVRVHSLKLGTTQTLKPGEQTLLNSKELITQKANLNKAIAWKNGYFIFDDDDIHDIMSQIARWYDIQVVYDGEFQNKKFGAVISRNKNVNEILKEMELTKGIHFKIEGRRVLVMK